MAYASICFLKYAGAMPATIGIAADLLFPAAPWQALHVSDLA